MSNVCPVCGRAAAPTDVACPSCGFKLSGATQSFKPVSLSHGDTLVQGPVCAEASLCVVRGPQKDMVFKLGDGALTIGRSPQCDIFLNDMTVSRMHAVVSAVEGGYIITDEHSFNGLWVNDVNVESRMLEPGDVIQIGAFCLVYQVK